MLRAALFDAVGTLIHLRAPVGETYARAARAHGLVVEAAAVQARFAGAMRAMPPMVFAHASRAEVVRQEREWWRQLVHRVLAPSGGSPQILDAVFATLFAQYGTADEWIVADGALELLARLRGRGLRTGMVSNFDHRLPALLDALGLRSALDVLVLPADAGAAKPDARIFALALERLGAAAEEAVYAGDDAEDDIAGAQRAGLRAVDVGSLSSLLDLDRLLA